MVNVNIHILHVLLLDIGFIVGISGLRDEVRLLKDILHFYDPAARPVVNQTDVVEVRMGVALFQIRELDEKNQFLQVNAWFQFHWTDPHLTWNTSEYGLQRVRIPSSRVWIPDIVLYNSVDETKPATKLFPETNAIVSSNGYVLWVVPAMIKSSCMIDVTYFPFDEQKCRLKFGSWTYDGFQLDLINLKDSGDLSKFLRNGEWDLISMPAIRNVEYYSCCAEPYVDVTYTIVIRRKPMFFTYNLVFPCVLLMGIGILVFCLPPESGEKVSLGVTVLLAMTVYQLLIAEAIPPTSDVIPLIGQFFGATIFLLSLSSAMTVLIMKLHFSGEHGGKVPKWLRKVVLVCLARVVRMNKTTGENCKRRDVIERIELEGQDSQYCHRDYENESSLAGNVSLLHQHRSTKLDERNCNILLNNVHERRPVKRKVRGHFSNHVSETFDQSDSGTLLLELLGHVKQLNEEIHQRHATDDTEEHYKSEWRMVALVLDRILLILFFIMTVFTCVVIFVNVPH